MRMLLASAGITNSSIHAALLDLLGKPIAECSALAITTASYAMPGFGLQSAWKFITGNEPECPMVGLGWKSIGVLELTALPSLDRDVWVPSLEQTDVLLVNGGDPLFLNYWMQQSGLAELLPSLQNLVYVSLSAGSMIMAPRIGDFFVDWKQPSGDDRTLGLIDFAIYPHLEHPSLPHNTMANAERWAATMPCTAYAIDDATAFTVVDGAMEVVSEGQWRAFNVEQ